jgi:hypothetical protein
MKNCNNFDIVPRTNLDILENNLYISATLCNVAAKCYVTTMVDIGGHWLTLMDIGGHWLTLVDIGGHWLTLSDIGGHWLTLSGC